MDPASDWYSVLVPVIMYVISYNIGPRYNGTRMYISRDQQCERTISYSDAINVLGRPSYFNKHPSRVFVTVCIQYVWSESPVLSYMHMPLMFIETCFPTLIEAPELSQMPQETAQCRLQGKFDNMFCNTDYLTFSGICVNPYPTSYVTAATYPGLTRDSHSYWGKWRGMASILNLYNRCGAKGVFHKCGNKVLRIYIFYLCI